MGKSTISMAIFNSKLLVITRGYKPSSIWAVYDIALLTFEVGPLWDVRKKRCIRTSTKPRGGEAPAIGLDGVRTS